MATFATDKVSEGHAPALIYVSGIIDAPSGLTFARSDFDQTLNSGHL